MFTLLAALLSPIQGPSATPVSSPVVDEATPIRITLNGGSRFGSGDRVRVQVETSDDGYLVVLRVDTDGHIRVLFPIDPDLDPFVRGGRLYELRGRADRQTFLADERNGTGVIYAAVSREPMRFRDFALGTHWDYEVLRLRDSESDPESELSQFVTRMTDNGRFDYDIVNYTVTGPYIASVGGAYPTVYGSYAGSYGVGYDPYWNCLSCRRWGYNSFGFGVSIGFGGGRYSPFYDPWNYGYYDPFFYDPYYYGSGYGRGYNSYPGSYWRYPGQSYPYTVVNLPRPRIPATDYGIRSRVRPTIPVLAGDLTRPGRSGALGGGNSTGRNTDRPTAGTNVGNRARQPAVRPPSRSSEPARSPAKAPTQVNRTPPSSSGSGAVSRGSSSGSSSSGSSTAGTRSRSRGGGDAQQQVTPTPPVSINRGSDNPRPVFREPPRPQTVTPTSRDNSRQASSPRPVYREPPRQQQNSPARASAPVVRSSPRPSSPPVVRSSPPPSSSPPARTSGGSSTTPPRSRQGGGGHR